MEGRTVLKKIQFTFLIFASILYAALMVHYYVQSRMIYLDAPDFPDENYPPVTWDVHCFREGWTIVYFENGEGGYCVTPDGDIPVVVRKMHERWDDLPESQNIVDLR